MEDIQPLDIYNLVQDCLTNATETDIFIHKLTEISSNVDNRDEFVDLLADTIVQIDIETSLISDISLRDAFLTLTKSIIKANLLPVKIALERFEVDTCALLGILNDKRLFMVSYNRLRTKLYFKQKKYNLLREENEGFAKVLTALVGLNSSNLDKSMTTVTQIIGTYRVDPNRVLDLILEVFEYNSRTEYELYVDFVIAFYNNPSKIMQLILLKLSFYETYKDDQTTVPQSFYRLIAILLHKDIFELEEIYPHFKPTDSKVLEYHKKLVEEGRQLARKYATAVVGEEKAAQKTVIESLNDEDRYSLEIDNQKVNICSHLINIGSWDKAYELARRLPEFYCFSNRRVAGSTCDLINYLIDPIYRDCALPKPLNSKISPLPLKKNLNQLTNISELPVRVFPMLRAIGPFLSADTLLLTKMIRILRHMLLQKENDQDLITSEKPLYFQILDVINDSILPATSLSGSNCCLARELWSLMKNFNYQVRYKLYYNWKDEGTSPVMLRNKGQILLRAKHHMKRLSKETLKLTGRLIGKLCYSNPVITLNYILVQIQSYDNLIGLVVDALRFIPPIAIDVLLYCIIEILSDTSKNKKSHDGMALATWLTSISSFSANIILRYKVEFTGFLAYIVHQLRGGNSLDLVLLTDLIQKMTGIETHDSITDDRIEALMGGDLLRIEGAYFNQVKNTRKPSARLKDALIESRLAMPICISMTQLRDSLFFNQQVTPLKLVGKLYDQCQETLVQYEAFLSLNLSIDDYINFLPPIEKLMTDHKLDPDSAFFLARPMILHKIKSKFMELKEAAASEVMIVEEGESPELSSQTIGLKFIEAAKYVVDPIAQTIQPFLVQKYGTSNLNAKLYVIFWTLSMSDIEVPINCYEREIQRLKSTVAELSKSGDDDPKKRKERERCNNLIQKLKQEQANQIENAEMIKIYLKSEKDNLFCEGSGYDHVYLESRQFVQHCTLARCILTASDAIYSARFILYMHELEVANYPTIICLDRLLCDLTYMMGACTENEANHYGRFLCNILKTTAHWHSDPVVYSAECGNYPGSIINMDSERITYDNYSDICFKWHYRLTRAFTVALESSNYIQIRNALIVMISIIDYYPAIKHFGKGVGMKIEDVRKNEKESRQDLYALATAYAGRLDEKKPSLIPESSFHHVDVKRKDGTPTNVKSSSTSTNSNQDNNKKDSNQSDNSTPKSDTNNSSSKHDTHSSANETLRKRMDEPNRSSSSSSSRPSSKTRRASPSPHRERHSSSSRKKPRHS